MSKTILIVNPVASAIYLNSKLKEFGIYTVALYTIALDKLSGYAQIDPQWFDKQIVVDSSFTNFKELLKDYHFDFIINGLDESFGIFEAICKEIMPSIYNEDITAINRSDKFMMQEALKQHGMPHIKQLRVTQANIDSVMIEPINYPCFLKPVKGAGSVGATTCNSYDEIKSNIQQSTTSFVGSNLDEFIIQELISGKEVFVDVFSSNGQHYISSVQTITKKSINGTPTYRYQHIIKDTQIWNNAVLFVKQSLDVCGFKNGFTHTELFCLSDGTFRLIEINPRISGSSGFCNKLAQISGLPTQIDLLNNYLNNLPLIEGTSDMVNCYFYLLYLYNFTNRPNQELSLKKTDFKSIHSIFKINNKKNIPDKVKTLTNVDCIVILYSTYEQQLLDDMQGIFKLEAQGLIL